MNRYVIIIDGQSIDGENYEPEWGIEVACDYVRAILPNDMITCVQAWQILNEGQITVQKGKDDEGLIGQGLVSLYSWDNGLMPDKGGDW